VARDRKKPLVERREAASSSSEDARVANGAKRKVRLAALRLPSFDRGDKESPASPAPQKMGQRSVGFELFDNQQSKVT